MIYPTICIFTYNRPKHFETCLLSLLKNKEFSKCKVRVFKDIEIKKNFKIELEYRKIFKKFNYLKNLKITKRKRKFGLKKNLISGISECLKKNNSIVVCEDDLSFSKYFLKYMINNLKKYANDKQVSSISGFSFNYKNQFKFFENEYFLKFTNSWGWATWSDRWNDFTKNNLNKYKLELYKNKNIQKKFNYDNAQPHTKWLKKSDQGNLSSWNIQWEFFCFSNNLLTLFPKYTFVQNNGLDGTGSHFGNVTNKYQEICENNSRKLVSRNKIKIIEKIKNRKIISDNLRKTLISRVKNKLSIYIKKILNFTI